MGARLLKALSSSLGARLLIPLFMIVAAGLSVLTILSFSTTKEHFLRFVAADANRTSGLILRATHDGMLLNQLAGVQNTIEQLAREKDVSAIRVYDKNSRVVLSGNRAEIGKPVRFGDDRVVRQLSVIRNEPGCMRSGCHEKAASQHVLGILDVEMSMQPFDHALGSARRQLMLSALLVALVIGAATTLMVKVLARSLLLEDKVAEEMAELHAAQSQVLHMEKMASLGKLAATVAHELNNPISGMLTYARLIERELYDQPLDAGVRAELERYLHLVQRECSRCGHIVQNLLVFARRGDTEPVPTDVNEIVERSLMLIRHHLEITGIRLDTHLLDGDAEIVADPDQLQQALVALLVNAIEAMSTGGQLTISVSALGDDVVIEVSDTGIGIDKDIVPLIFEPFFSTKNRESGSGLGLAVVYGIVHRHGGTIDVVSTPAAGTTFRMQLPRNHEGAVPYVSQAGASSHR